MTTTTTTINAPDLAKLGREYIDAGFSVVPVGRDKRPHGPALPRDPETGKPTWKPVQLAPPDAATVERWARMPEVRGFAAVCGEVSGGLLVFDFDAAGFYERWREAVGDMADGLPVQRTGGGGHQVALRCDEPGGNDKLAWTPDSAEDTGRTIAIETRGEGGYAVLPGSMHPSGKRYQAIAGDWWNVPRVDMARVRFMLDAARQLDEAPMTRQQLERAAKLKPKPRQAQNGRAGIIEQWNAQRPLADMLERNGYRRVSEDRFARPGGSSPSVYLFTDREPARSFHHSSNDPLHDPAHARDSFDVLCELEHGGDAGAAVKAAAHELGIERPQPSRDSAMSGDHAEGETFIVESADPLRLAEHVLDQLHRDDQGRATLRRWRNGWWVYQRGGYVFVEDEALAGEVYSLLDQTRQRKTVKRGDEFVEVVEPITVNARIVSEVAKALPSRGILISGDAPQWLADHAGQPDPRELVVFRNGILNARTYCESGGVELLPPTPDYFAGGSCPYDFDPDADCPAFKRWIGETLPDDPSIALAQEYAGLLLVPDNSWERFLMLCGPPRSGKGTYVTALQTMLGANQCATTSFAKLSGRFGLSPLVGKLAAFMPDAHITRNTDAKGALEVLKSITGNDAQAIDRKHRDELPEVHLPVRFVVAVNELPELPDDAGALRERLLMLHFATSFAGHEDTTLKERIRAEGPGLAIWALEGLRRLRAQGGFTVPERSAVMVREFEKAVNPVKGFLDECCELGADYWQAKADVFAAWKAWAEDRGQAVGSKAQFGQRLVNTGLVQAGKGGPASARFPVYRGLRLCGE